MKLTIQQRQVAAHHAARLVDAHRGAIRYEIASERARSDESQNRNATLAAEMHRMAENAMEDLLAAVEAKGTR